MGALYRCILVAIVADCSWIFLFIDSSMGSLVHTPTTRTLVLRKNRKCLKHNNSLIQSRKMKRRKMRQCEAS